VPANSRLVVVFVPKERIPAAPKIALSVQLLEPGAPPKSLSAVPIPSERSKELYYVRDGVLVDGEGRAIGRLPCRRLANGGDVTGVVLAPYKRILICIDAVDDAGPLLALDLRSGAVRRLSRFTFMNLGYHDLSINGALAYALVLDKTCGGQRGYERYPLRAAYVNLASGQTQLLECTGSIVIGESGLVRTRMEPGGQWWFEDNGWHRGYAQGVSGNESFYILDGCLGIAGRTGCIARGVMFAGVF
jgi:hypothetical protein